MDLKAIPNLKYLESNNFFLIAGPCAIEGEEMAFKIAENCIKICDKLKVPYIFKGSFKKANRSRIDSFTGIGDEIALKILKKLNGKVHNLISSVCISKNGAMLWNHTDSSELKMKKLDEKLLIEYLNKIKTETLQAYGVYQIEASGLDLFEYVKGDTDSIMGLPIKQIMNYIKNYKDG